MTNPTTNPQAALREFDFDQPVVNIGSNPDNDVIITGAGVMPFHASFLQENGSFNIIPMAPEAEIKLDGKLLHAVSASVSENQCINIGDYSLYLQRGITAAGFHLTIYKGSGGQIEAPFEPSKADGEQSILVNLIDQQNTVEVEQSASYEFEVVNGGRYVASFQVAVQGVPSDWVQITPRFVNLNEGHRARVRISITPPREPISTAGTHALNIIVTSPNYPRQRSVTLIELTIQPYYEFMASNISPRQQHIRWRDHKGIVALPIYNNSNCSADFNIMAVDDENGCTFDFEVDENVRHTRQTSVSINAGETCDLPIEVTPNRNPIISIRNKHYHYTATTQIAGQPVAPQTLSGTIINHPLLGWLAVLLSVLLVVMGLFFLVQPRINSFDVAAGKDVIELGDTTSLEWSVSPFASRLSISNVDKEINRSMNHYTVAPDQSTTYELVAGNWISGLLGMDYTDKATVLVVPPSPNIAVFDVDKKEVDKGNAVKIRWSVTDTDKLLLTIDEVVYELTDQEFSGERSIVMENDSVVTLEASNLSGSELRSYYIDVAPPNIDIKTYTVWVRPEGSTAAVVDQNPRLALSNPSSKLEGLAAVASANDRSALSASDADFSEKFVELVADDTSDTGYKVVFYQPDRELAKGEQVMLEWEVEGVEKLAIAPFTQELPASGKQPYFPQESMNFVLTAQSGDLEKLFMLPVNVFDGEPPTAPKVDFFKAVPTQMVGAGDVQFSWSVSGEWTHIQLAKGTDDGEEVVADWINPQGFKKIKVTESGTFLLKAWNGELSTAQPVDITVNPALKKIDLNIIDVYTDAGRFMVGRSVIITVGFTNIPADSPKPTGKVTVTDGYSTCSINLPALSCELTFITPGEKTITASYEGDTVYLQDDSDPYSQTILVESAEVELIPRYFKLGTDTVIGDITSSSNDLSLESGLRIIVEVRPKNVNIPDDGMSKVSVSLCDQDATGAMIEGTCSFVADGTAVAATETDTVGRQTGKFYVDVSIYSFTQPGTHILLFDYSHDEGTINPTSFEQPNVPVGKVHFHLSSDICDGDPIAGAYCKFGSADPSTSDKITFNFHTTKDEDIATTLPEPDSADFTFTPVGETGTSASPLACSITKPNGVYKMVCETNDMTSAGNTWTVNYIFDNDSSESYTMDTSTGSFSMDVLNTTGIIITDPGRLTVGQTLQLTGTGGIVSVQDQVTSSVLSVPLIISDASGAGLTSFGCSSTENCSESDGKITILNSTSNSSIFVKKAGEVEITATYEGDGTNYLGSSADQTLMVSQLGGITSTWKSQTGEWPNDLIVNVPLTARVELDVTTTGISENVLVGRKMLVKFTNQNAIGACSLNAPGTGTEGEYLVTITSFTTGPVADFTLTCGNSDIVLPFDAYLEIGFVTNGEDTEGDDFAFSATADIDEEVRIKANDSAILETTLKLTPVTSTTLNMTGSDTSVLTFLAGEKYQLNFKLRTIYGHYNTWFDDTYDSAVDIINDYVNSDNYVVITFPPAVENAIDWENSTCGIKNDVKVKLDQAVDIEMFESIYSDIWRWGSVHFNLTSKYPCYLVFNKEISLNQNTTFSFISHNEFYKASTSYNTTGVTKQNVNMTFDPTSPFNGLMGISQVIKINLASATNTDTTLPPIESDVTSFDTQFSVATSCGTISDKKINSTSQAQFTLSSTAECVGQTVTIDYLQNDYFNKLEDQAFTFSFNKHASDTRLEYYNGTSWSASFPFNATTNATQNVGYKFRVKVVDYDGHASIPTGSVQVKVNGTATYTVKDSYGSTVTDSGGYYVLNLDGTGYAEFTITFTSTTSNIALQYEYPGSDYFKTSNGKSGMFNVVAP